MVGSASLAGRFPFREFLRRGPRCRFRIGRSSRRISLRPLPGVALGSSGFVVRLHYLRFQRCLQLPSFRPKTPQAPLLAGAVRFPLLCPKTPQLWFRASSARSTFRLPPLRKTFRPSPVSRFASSGYWFEFPRSNKMKCTLGDTSMQAVALPRFRVLLLVFAFPIL